MPEPTELPPRPLPPRRAGAALAAWGQWFGVGRLVTSALSVVIVVGGAFWLLRAPTPGTEASLPVSTGGAPNVTIAPPSTMAAGEAAAIEVASTTASPVVVHVAGAVQLPGVYELAAAARVADAVALAGGVTSDGDLDGLNLAAPIVDGERIYVPRQGEVDPAAVPSGAGTSRPSEAAGGSVPPARPIDLNVATAAELETLSGVGPATAAAIVDDRTRNGPFASVDDLDRVPGIGPAKLDSLRDLVTV